MLKISNLFVVILVLFMFNGCVSRDLAVPQNHNQSNFIDDNIDKHWGDDSKKDDIDNSNDESIDISDIDEELTQKDMTSLQNSTDIVQRIAFPISEYKKLAKSGKGTIKGEIYLLDLYGQKVYGKNTRLYLNPMTSYADQWYQESYIKGRRMSEPDSRLFNYLRFTASDNDGRFAFYGIPSGSYYLIGTVQCGNQCGFDTLKSIRVATKVTIQGNQIIKQDIFRQIHAQ